MHDANPTTTRLVHECPTCGHTVAAGESRSRHAFDVHRLTAHGHEGAARPEDHTRRVDPSEVDDDAGNPRWI